MFVVFDKHIYFHSLVLYIWCLLYLISIYIFILLFCTSDVCCIWQEHIYFHCLFCTSDVCCTKQENENIHAYQIQQTSDVQNKRMKIYMLIKYNKHQMYKTREWKYTCLSNTTNIRCKKQYKSVGYFKVAMKSSLFSSGFRSKSPYNNNFTDVTRGKFFPSSNEMIWSIRPRLSAI